jgi:hypothetical protein
MNSALFKKPSFWLVSGLFLIVVVGMIVYVFPPLFSRFSELRTVETELKAEQAKQQQYTDLLSNLSKNKDTVANLYQSAEQAMPSTVKADFLLIQLDSMTDSIGLGSAKLVVPFSQGVVATPAATGSSSDATRGSSANSSQPVVKSDTSGSQTTFSISGEISFPSVQSLIQSLRGLSRWNRITSIDLGLNGEAPTATITAQVFTLPSRSTTFTGTDTNFLKKAEALFSSAKAYTTQPDSTSEGSYGRANPFSPVK